MESYEYTIDQDRSRTLVVVLEKEQYLVSWKSTNIMKVILTLCIPKGVFPIPRDHFQKMMSVVKEDYYQKAAFTPFLSKVQTRILTMLLPLVQFHPKGLNFIPTKHPTLLKQSREIFEVKPLIFFCPADIQFCPKGDKIRLILQYMRTITFPTIQF